MNVEEIFIAHTLYGNPGKTHLTSDGQKLYFILEGRLVFVEAPKGTSYNGMTEEELARTVQAAILESTSH